MKKKTFENLVECIVSNIVTESKLSETKDRLFTPTTIKKGGTPDYDIWVSLQKKGNRTRLANRIQKELRKKTGWNLNWSSCEVSIGRYKSVWPEDEVIAVRFYEYYD